MVDRGTGLENPLGGALILYLHPLTPLPVARRALLGIVKLGLDSPHAYGKNENWSQEVGPWSSESGRTSSGPEGGSERLNREIGPSRWKSDGNEMERSQVGRDEERFLGTSYVSR